jgi:hypothetical protein
MRKLLVGVFALLYGIANAQTPSESPIFFYDLTEQAQVIYHRSPSESYAEWEALQQEPYITSQMQRPAPYKPWGAPGVAILDFDGDGYQDIYVTNGPHTHNSLYRNQLGETGQLTFVDVGVSAGVGAFDQDSNGVCYGDTDNDGDPDLYVVGYGQNLFFENQGDGTFADKTASSGLGSQVLTGVGCSMGDINGDGLLDIVVANAFDLANQDAFVTPYEANQPNQLFLNTGGNIFRDVSTRSGILENGGLPAGTAAITWATAMADYDLDGDVDIFFADDQTGIPSTAENARQGHDRGFIQVFQNDGTGHFVNQTIAYGMPIGDWMGLSFGDLNCDGYLDFFATNLGDYFAPFSAQKAASRWFLGQPSGGFYDSIEGELDPSSFGWGTSMLDYDNDTDLDIVYYGAHNTFWELQLSNPGMVLQNQGCTAQFVYDVEAMAARHIYRLVEGVAAGDLNNDGFPDVVSVSSMDISRDTLIRPTVTRFGSPLNNIAGVVPILVPDGDGRTKWVFSQESAGFNDGSLSLEINSASNGNQWVKVELLGSSGLTSQGRTNRAGIGAVIRFTPEGGLPVLKPVIGGASYASQDSLIQIFGLGKASSGTIEVLWTGGIRNRLYNVMAGEQIRFPEIPCSYDLDDPTAYQTCLETSLAELFDAQVLDEALRQRLWESAWRAYQETH